MTFVSPIKGLKLRGGKTWETKGNNSNNNNSSSSRCNSSSSSSKRAAAAAAGCPFVGLLCGSPRARTSSSSSSSSRSSSSRSSRKMLTHLRFGVSSL